MAEAKLQNKYDINELRGRPLGRVLVKMGKLTREQVHEALEKQKETGGPIGDILVEMELIDSDTRALALAFQQGMEFVDLGHFDIEPNVISQIPAQMANAYKVIPLEYDKDTNHLTVAIASPDNFRATDDLRTLMGYSVTAKVAEPAALEASLMKYYDVEPESIADLINEVAGDDQLNILENRGESIDLATIKEMADSNPVKTPRQHCAAGGDPQPARATSTSSRSRTSSRCDTASTASSTKCSPPPKSIAVAIASRVKVMAGLDIAERRLPQDGRIELVVNGNPVDLRIAVLPTMFGESVVMRVLDRSNVQLDLDRLGLREDDLRLFRQLIHRPHGIIVVDGPDGLGKDNDAVTRL